MLLLLNFLFVLCAWASQCHQPPLKQEAQAQFKVWGFHVYDVEYEYDNLYPAPPYRLTLEYKREIEGKKIVETTEKEIRRLGGEPGKLTVWMTQLEKIIPNVKSGDSLVGFVDDKKRSLFCFGNKFLGQIDDPEFADYFFGIWLSDKTSEPRLRRRLLDSAKIK
jgi:hypothetical protein